MHGPFDSAPSGDLERPPPPLSRGAASRQDAARRIVRGRQPGRQRTSAAAVCRHLANHGSRHLVQCLADTRAALSFVAYERRGSRFKLLRRRRGRTWGLPEPPRALPATAAPTHLPASPRRRRDWLSTSANLGRARSCVTELTEPPLVGGPSRGRRLRAAAHGSAASWDRSPSGSARAADTSTADGRRWLARHVGAAKGATSAWAARDAHARQARWWLGRIVEGREMGFLASSITRGA